MSVAKFLVRGRLDSAGGDMDGILSIDRTTGVVYVRPKGRRQIYETTLRELADWICKTNLVAQVKEAKVAKKAARVSGGG
jgi:hypothetical protein